MSSYGNTTATLNRDQVQRKTIRAFPASEQAPKQCDNALQDDYATLYVLLRISPVRKYDIERLLNSRPNHRHNPS